MKPFPKLDKHYKALGRVGPPKMNLHRGPAPVGGGRKKSPTPKRKALMDSLFNKGNFNPNSPLTGKQARRRLNADVALEFDPLARQLAAEHSASERRQNVEIPAWFNEYGQSVAGAGASSSAAYQKAQDYLAQRLQDAGSQDAAERARLDAAEQADAAKRGTSVDPSLARAAAAAGAARQALGAQQAGTVAAQGANQTSYLADKGRIGKGEQIQQALNEARRRRGIESDQRELAQKRGDFSVKDLADIIKGERDFNLQLGALDQKGNYAKAIVNQARLGLRGKKLTAGAQQRVAKTQQNTERISQRGQKAVAKQQGKNVRRGQRLKNKGYKNLPGSGKSKSGSKAPHFK